MLDYLRILRGAAVLAVLLTSSCGHLASRRLSGGPLIREEQVVFRYYAPSARRVQLAGSWPENNWARGDGRVGEADIGLMEDDDANGVWEIKIALSPGRYKYVFWVDENTWHIDPGNPEEVEGGPAQLCSQLLVVIQNGKMVIR